MSFCGYLDVMLLSGCPDQCQCHRVINGLSINCSSLGLTQIPPLMPSEAVEIHLTHNKITRLRSEDFRGCFNLTLLDFTANWLRKIETDALMDLSILKVLVLTENNLQYSSHSFPEKLFSYSSHLESVRIDNNVLYYDPKLADMVTVVKELPVSLKELYIDLPCNETFASVLAVFVHLTELDLFRDSTCRSQLANNTFEPLQGLPIKKLKIQYGSLTRIEPLAFVWFSHLELLDLSNTVGMNVANIHPAWIGLKRTRIEVILLSHFRQKCVDPDPVILNSTFFHQFDLPYLKRADFDNTNIYDVKEWRYPRKVNNLQHISFAFNSIGHDQMWRLTQITHKLERLRNLDLSFQAKSSQPFVFVVLSPQMTTLNISGVNTFLKEHEIREIILQDYNSLTTFEYRNNFLKNLRKLSIAKPNRTVLLNVDMSNNKLTTLYPDVLSESIAKGLRIGGLMLSDNRLGEQFDNQTCDVFKNYPEMKILDLSLNGINTLADTMFANLTSLEILNLSSNFLNTISFKFAHMNKLLAIDLSNNRLSRVNSEAQTELNLLKLKHVNLTVNMSGNPFECSCDTISSLQWIILHRNMFWNFDRYNCFHRGTMVEFSNLDSVLHNLEFQCSINVIIGWSTGMLAFVVLIVAISVCLHRHKWDIRFFCIKFVTRRNKHRAIEESRVEYEFDAFVAYHKNDLNWVLKELFENLGDKDTPADVPDNQSRFRLCIHDRNFIPGDTIEDNIVRAIEKSRKTILVLSKNFLASEWCKFELQMARMEGFNKGRNIIIAVMLEPLPLEKMSKTLQLMARRDTYIEWSDDPSGRTAFWDKMRKALGREGVEAFVCECGRMRHQDASSSNVSLT